MGEIAAAARPPGREIEDRVDVLLGSGGTSDPQGGLADHASGDGLRQLHEPIDREVGTLGRLLADVEEHRACLPAEFVGVVAEERGRARERLAHRPAERPLECGEPLQPERIA